MIRRLDKVGRICIPTSIRKQHGWTRDTDLIIIPTEKGISVEPYDTGCALCGGHDHLIEMKNGKRMCMGCTKEVKEIWYEQTI